MPAQIDVAAPTARIGISPIADLAFCLFVVEKRSAGRGKWTQPWLAAITAEAPDLLSRIEQFWHDEGYYEWIELSLIADAAGTLFDESEDIDWTALTAAAAGEVPIGELRTEGAGVRRVLERRLSQLRDDSKRRGEYFTLLRDFWRFLLPFYEHSGRPAALKLAAEMREHVASGRDLESMLPANHLAMLDKYVPMVEEAEREGRLVLVALGLSGVGSGLLDVPGAMWLSYSPEARRAPAHQPEVAPRIATQLKVLSDPPRVTILLQLVHGPRSITALARVEGLSQPTVSVHVKLLREAGLLETQGARGRKLYFAPPEKVRALLEGIRDEFQASADDSC